MLFRPSRDRRGSDRYLIPKIILLAAGGTMAIAGFMLELDWLVTGAVVPLAIGLALNVWRSRESPEPDDTEPEDPS